MVYYDVNGVVIMILLWLWCHNNGDWKYIDDGFVMMQYHDGVAILLCHGYMYLDGNDGGCFLINLCCNDYVIKMMMYQNQR